KSWGWSEAYLGQLDNPSFLYIDQVRKEYDLLFNTIMKSYRNLNSFGRRNHLNSTVSPQDMAVLTRKLYAAYESLPDKVSLFTPSIIACMEQRDLTFIYASEEGVNPSGWYVYNQTPVFEEIVSRQPIEHQKSLVKVFAWCYFNGMFKPHTQLYLRGKHHCNEQKFKRFAKDMRAYFPVVIPAATEEALRKPSKIKQMAIILNLESDPTRFLDNKALRHIDTATVDVLNFGAKQQSLIGSIDILYRNSWNEVRVMHVSGQHCVIEAIETVL